MSSYNVFEFFRDTWEARRDVENDRVNDLRLRTGRGRHKKDRIPYSANHPSFLSKCRILRNEGHNNIPDFVEMSFCRNDDAIKRSLYCATILMLLKPWRDIAVDLKNPDENWDHAFNSFFQSTSQRNRDIIDNIQYYHECRNAAQHEHAIPLENHEDDRDTDLMGNEVMEDILPVQLLTNHEDLESPRKMADEIYARLAIEIAEQTTFFPSNVDVWNIIDDNNVQRAQDRDFQNLKIWKEALMNDSQHDDNMNSISINDSLCSRNHDDGNQNHLSPDVQLLSYLLNNGSSSDNSCSYGVENDDSSLNPNHEIQMFNDDQKRAYKIILWHLDETLQGHDLPPLRMIIYGEGGTGKSSVIQAISEGFKKRLVKNRLLKSAYTGFFFLTFVNLKR